MVKFCRNCGKELAHSSVQTCTSCGAHSVKATSFCRFCGHTTTAGDDICAHCGSTIKPLPTSARVWSEKTKKLMKAGKIVNLTIVIAGVTAYVIFTLPPNLTKAVTTATGDAVMSSTGYTALPVRNIVAVPFGIPPWQVPRGFHYALAVATNATRQLTIYAVRINTTSDNATKAARLDEVTGNCSFKSSDENIATVNASGFVQVRSAGQANITAIYTAPAGTANMSNAAAGKIATTFTVDVLVNAEVGGISAGRTSMFY